MIIDLTLVIYLTIFVLSTIGFILFAWWWRKNSSATIIYAYITFLFFAESYSKLIEIYARMKKTIDPELYFQILSGSFFSFRNIPQVIIYFLIIWHVSCRIRKTIQGTRQIRMSQSQIDKDFTAQILVVEDNEDVCSVLDASLQKYFPNGKIFCAGRVQEALDILEQNPEIEVIVTDLKLPKRTGIQLCSMVKEERPWVSVIAITGYDEIYGFWHARVMGFDDYLMKPFRVGDLITSIQRESEKIKHWHKIHDRTGNTICNGNVHKRDGDITEDTLVGGTHTEEKV